MHSLRHFYYQNKEKIWKIILIVVLILGIIYFINSTIINDNNVNVSTDSGIYYDEGNKTYISEQSAISGGTLTETEITKVNNTISKFLGFCKEQKSEEAYAMLSEDCKQERYTSLEKFTEGYINKKFNKDQVYEIENWINNTYKVTISQDLLATGNINSGNQETEYITIVKQDNQDKLNVNGYIGKKSINRETTKNNITMKVLEKQTYMDYEEYSFEITNLSNKTIKLDSFENTGTIYLRDRSGNKYNAQMHEILEEEATINSKQTFNLKIKFTNAYYDTTNISSITFENVILDYYKYKKNETNEDFEEICEFVINL